MRTDGCISVCVSTRAVLSRMLAFLFAGEEQYTSGFLDLDSIDRNSIVTLPDSSLSNTDLLSSFRQWIFPNINFTCDGYITSWTLRVNNSMPESMETPLIPLITTWRPLEIAGRRSNFYRQRSITNESQLTSQKIDTQLMFTPSPPGIPVRAGDIVGIRLPSVDDDMLTIKPLFLRLSQGNSSISCAGLDGDTTNFQFDTANQMCGGNDPGQQQSIYIPLISVNISKSPHCIYIQVTCIQLKFLHIIIFPGTNISTSVSPSPSIAPTSASTPPATITIAPTPPPTPQDSTSGLMISTTMDLAAPPQPGANSGQLVGVIVGALVAALSLVLIVILAIFLILLLTRRRSQKLYDVPVPPQPQNMDNPVYTGRCRCSNRTPPLHNIIKYV